LRLNGNSERTEFTAEAMAGELGGFWGDFFQRADGEWQVFNVVVSDAGGAPDTEGLSANKDVGEVAAQLWKEANPDGRQLTVLGSAISPDID
jgi:hypothetical protein